MLSLPVGVTGLGVSRLTIEAELRSRCPPAARTEAEGDPVKRQGDTRFPRSPASSGRRSTTRR